MILCSLVMRQLYLDCAVVNNVLGHLIILYCNIPEMLGFSFSSKLKLKPNSPLEILETNIIMTLFYYMLCMQKIIKK